MCYAILGNRKRTLEFLTTLYCLDELSRNVRSLTPVSADSSEFDVINLYYFFLGHNDTFFPHFRLKKGLITKKFTRDWNYTNASSTYFSDFRYESNRMFVLGVGFFSSDKFRISH